MNTKLAFILVLLLLVILLLFYYIDIESNIIILLGVTIILIVHHLIKKSEHFSIASDLSATEAKVDTLLGIAKALQSTASPASRQYSDSSDNTDAMVDFATSCPISLPNIDDYSRGIFNSQTGWQVTAADGIKLPFQSELGNITPDELYDTISAPSNPV